MVGNCFRAAALLLALTFFFSTNEVLSAAFQNLGFESPTFVPVPSPYTGSVEPVLALPGWTAYAGTNLVPYVLAGNLFLDSTGASLFAGSLGGFPAPVEGNFVLLLQGGVHPPWLPGGPPSSFDRMPMIISQTALVPSTARTLTFWSSGPGVSVSMNGQNLPILLLSTGPANYNFYGIDISSFAGTTAELRFTENPPPQSAPTDINNALLDGIAFSPTPIPEPDAMTIAFNALALVLVAPLCRKKLSGPSNHSATREYCNRPLF